MALFGKFGATFDYHFGKIGATFDCHFGKFGATFDYRFGKFGATFPFLSWLKPRFESLRANLNASISRYVLASFYELAPHPQRETGRSGSSEEGKGDIGAYQIAKQNPGRTANQSSFITKKSSSLMCFTVDVE